MLRPCALSCLLATAAIAAYFAAAAAGAQQGPALADAPVYAPLERFEATAPPPLQIWMLVDGQQTGPLDAAGFRARLGTPEAAARTLVWMPGMAEWQLASTVAALQSVIASIGQDSAAPDAFAVADMPAYMLGAWVSEPFYWGDRDGPIAIVQIKLLPDGSYEGAVVFQRRESDKPFPFISHQKGRWSVRPEQDGSHAFERTYTYTDIDKAEIIGTGTSTSRLVVRAEGPDMFRSEAGVGFVRVPEAG